jgi:hypothetical protein
MSILNKIFGKKGSGYDLTKGKTCPSCGASNPLNVKFCSACGSEFHIVSDTFDAFISYRRESGSDLASLLKLQLESRFNKRIFLDVNELQVGRFDEELLHRIEKTPNFIVILSRASLDRCANKTDWLKREIMHALMTGRNIIPVMTDGFVFPSDELWALLPSEMVVLPSLNGVNYSHIHQDSAIRKIASYMKMQIEIPVKQISQSPPKINEPSTKSNSEPSLLETTSSGSRSKEPEKKGSEYTPAGTKDLSAQKIAAPVKQDNESSAIKQKENLEFYDDEWGDGTTINLKLLGTSSKDRRIFKNETHYTSSMNLKISESIAYLPTSEGIRAFNVSDPKSPKLVSLFPAGQSTRKWFELIEHIGFIRGSDASVNVIDYTDPTNPKGIGFDNYHRNIFNNCGNGLLIYNKTIMIDLCHEESCGVKVLDFSDTNEISKNVRTVGVIKYRTGCGTLYKNYLLLGNSSHPQLRIVSLNKERIEEIKTVPIETLNGGMLPQGIVTDDERLYVFGTNITRRFQPILSIYSLKNFPEELEYETSLELPKEQNIKALFGLQVFLSDKWLYYNDSSRFCLYDISRPDQPELAFSIEGSFYVMSISKNIMYCGDDRNIWAFEIVRKRR